MKVWRQLAPRRGHGAQDDPEVEGRSDELDTHGCARGPGQCPREHVLADPWHGGLVRAGCL
eukprot:6521330-Alexandrium_andersonii.AAC.2